jgi:hypothetical protein
MATPQIISREELKRKVAEEKQAGRFFYGTFLRDPQIKFLKTKPSELPEGWGYPCTLRNGRTGVFAHCKDPNNPEIATTAHIEKYERVWNANIRQRAEQKMANHYNTILTIIALIGCFPYDHDTKDKFNSELERLNLKGTWVIAHKKLIEYSKEKGYRNFNTDTCRVFKTANMVYWIANCNIPMPEDKE